MEVEEVTEVSKLEKECRELQCMIELFDSTVDETKTTVCALNELAQGSEVPLKSEPDVKFKRNRIGQAMDEMVMKKTAGLC